MDLVLDLDNNIKEKCKEVQKLNQLNLEETSLVCCFCFNWLVPPIYTFSNGWTYCGPCTEELGGGLTQNKTLEELLEFLIYPCLHCRFYKGRHAVMIQHMNKCLYAPLKCPILGCQASETTPRGIFTHMKLTHKMEIVEIDLLKPCAEAKAKLTFTIPSDASLIKNYYLVTLNTKSELLERQFIIQVEAMPRGLGLQISVGTSGLDSGTNTRFIVKFLKEKAVGTIVDLQTMFQGGRNINKHKAIVYVALNQCTVKDIDLVLTFGNNEWSSSSNANHPTCATCCQVLSPSGRIFLCQEEHKTCGNCKVLSGICNMCHLPIRNVHFHGSIFYPRVNHPCPNEKYGCLVSLRLDQVEDHFEECQYVEVACEVCKRKFPKFNIWSHMMKHGDSDLDLENGSTIYEGFNNEMFCCTVTRKNNQGVCFNVRMLHSKAKQAENYRYELHFGDIYIGGTLLFDYRIGNLCQDARDHSTSSVFTLDTGYDCFQGSKRSVKLFIFHLNNN